MVVTLHCITLSFLILSVPCYGENMTSVLDIRDQHHTTTKYIAALLFIISLLYGITSNGLMVTVLFCRGRDNPYSNAFVLIALQLVISNLMAFLSQLIVVLPGILKTTNSPYAYQTTWINQTFSTFIIFPFSAIFHFSFLLTINRFVAIILPKYNDFFESKRLYYTIALVWLSVIAVTICDFHYCARKFLAWELSWEENCLKSNEAGETWWRIRYLWTLFIPNAMFGLYVAIFNIIRRKRMRMNAVKTNKYEWLLLIQAAWNCGTMEIGIISFNFLPQFLVQIFGEGINIASRIFINCYLILICAVFPTLHFIYCRKARSFMKSILYRWSYLKMSIAKEIGIGKSEPSFDQYSN